MEHCFLIFKCSVQPAHIRIKCYSPESQLDSSKVLVLSKVKIKNQSNGMELDYLLVADGEADLAAGKISVNSPIGKGLLGKSVGDVAEIQVPNGILKFEIMNISR